MLAEKGANHRGRLEDGKEKKISRGRERIYIYIYIRTDGETRGAERKESWRLKSKTDDSQRECESLLFAHQ